MSMPLIFHSQSANIIPANCFHSSNRQSLYTQYSLVFTSKKHGKNWLPDFIFTLKMSINTSSISPWSIDMWKGGNCKIPKWLQSVKFLFSMLQRGMRQEYHLGQFLRQRYNGFINASYIRTEVCAIINPYKPEFTIVIFINYKPRIAVAILDL